MPNKQPFLRASNSGLQAICTCGEPMWLGNELPGGIYPANCEYCNLYAKIAVSIQPVQPAAETATVLEAPR